MANQPALARSGQLPDDLAIGACSPDSWWRDIPARNQRISGLLPLNAHIERLGAPCPQDELQFVLVKQAARGDVLPIHDGLHTGDGPAIRMGETQRPEGFPLRSPPIL